MTAVILDVYLKCPLSNKSFLPETPYLVRVFRNAASKTILA
jgi:hypothetical protein